MDNIKVNSIDKVIEKAVNNIKLHYRTIGDKNGWHQYLGNDKIGNIATAQALILLNTCKVDFDNKQEAFKYLTSSQMNDLTDFRIHGGWSYVTNFSDLPSTECTSWVLLALHENFQNETVTKNGIKWLLNNHDNSKTDVGWGVLQSDIPRIYSSCLALQVLNKYGYNNTKEFKSGLNWLLNSQNSDNGWGEQFGYTSTIFHTSFVINTLMDIYKTKNSVIENGLKWLNNAFDKQTSNSELNLGSQEIIDFNFNIGSKPKHQRINYFHTPLPQAIIAFTKTGNVYNKNLFKLLNEIVNNNNDGYWKHPNFNNLKQKPMWLIFDMVMSLKIFTENIKNWSSIDSIRLKGNKLYIVNMENPFDFNIFLNKFILGRWGKVFLILLLCVFISYLFEFFPNLENKHYISLILVPLIVELLGYYITEIKKKEQ